MIVNMALLYCYNLCNIQVNFNTIVNQKTLFRIQNGFRLFNDHRIISKYLNKNNNLQTLKTPEIDLISSIFELLKQLSYQCGEF